MKRVNNELDSVLAAWVAKRVQSFTPKTLAEDATLQAVQAACGAFVALTGGLDVVSGKLVAAVKAAVKVGHTRAEVNSAIDACGLGESMAMRCRKAASAAFVASGDRARGKSKRSRELWATAREFLGSLPPAFLADKKHAASVLLAASRAVKTYRPVVASKSNRRRLVVA